MSSSVAASETPGRAEKLGFVWAWFATFAVIAGLFAWIIAVHGTEGLESLGFHAAWSMAVFGKFIIFSGAHPEILLSPWHFAIMVWVIDLLVTLFIMSFVDKFSSVPLLGRWFERGRRKAKEKLEKHPRLENMAFWGVVLVVFLPLASTGAVIGSFAGQLVGLRRLTTVFGVALGSFMTALVFGAMAFFLGPRAEQIIRSELFVGICMLGLIVFGVWAYAQVRKIIKRRRTRGGTDSDISALDAK